MLLLICSILVFCTRAEQPGKFSVTDGNARFASAEEIRRYLYSILEKESSPEILLKVAVIANEYEDEFLTRDCLTKYFASGENKAMAYFLQGSISYSGNDFDQAIIHLKKSISGGLNHFEQNNLLARAYLGINRPDSAMQALELSMLEFPDNSETCYLAGNALLALQDTAGSLKHFEKSIMLDPGNQDAIEKAVFLYLNHRDRAATVRFIEKQLQISDHFFLKRSLAGLYISMNNYRGADSLLRSISNNLDPATLYILRAKLNFAKSYYDSAVIYTDKILVSDSRNLDALEIKGRIMDRAGQYYDALGIFEMILKIDSANTTAINETGNLRRKIAYLRKISQQHDEMSPQPDSLEQINIQN
ncbi:MAG TPA: hypothetical protein VI583_01700 [Cyclobacteriaceae bacterium]|nr:hypothetical protein [Cyclobacteriaceae bacterium]